MMIKQFCISLVVLCLVFADGVLGFRISTVSQEMYCPHAQALSSTRRIQRSVSSDPKLSITGRNCMKQEGNDEARLTTDMTPGWSSSRRSFLRNSIAIVGSAVSTGLILQPTAADADDKNVTGMDPLDAFGKQLQEDRKETTAKWPDSPSPLPTRTRSAQDLTQPTEEDRLNSDISDMEKMLQQSAKKKQIAPRTHG